MATSSGQKTCNEKEPYLKGLILRIPRNYLRKFAGNNIFENEFNNRVSKLNSVALKAFMMLAGLLLQKPSAKSKAKEHSACLEHRLELWKKGELYILLKEIRKIQSKFMSLKRRKTEKDTSRIFANFFEPIDEQLILKAALKTEGSAGPSGMDADLYRRILCSKNFNKLIGEGRKYGYYVNSSKSWLMVKSQDIMEEADNVFESPQHYESSTTLTKPHVDSIIAQSMIMHYTDEDIRRAADINNEAQLDIKANGFWRLGQNAFFDVRITHVNAASNRNQSTERISHQHELEKERSYMERITQVEHGAFTPLVMGTNGGMGFECRNFLSILAKKLALKQNESYSSAITWIRTKLSFKILHSVILCVRGSRRPWRVNKDQEMAENFGLNIFNTNIL
eukprot:gene11719-12940_t